MSYESPTTTPLPAWRLLRSPRLALFTLSLTTLYAAVASWFPWLSKAAVPPPDWVVKLGLDHPFRSLPFLAGCTLLLVNTSVCTWDRFKRVCRLWQGELPRHAVELPGGSAEEAFVFLRNSGFTGRGAVLFKNRFALWGGFILHLGIIAIILSVAVQQVFSDGGSFELSEGELVVLDTPKVVFGHVAGYLAPAKPPRLGVALDRFNAYLQQPGYAPDRQSALVVFDPAQPDRKINGEIDRACGLTLSDTTIYQAIPTGYAINIELQGDGLRSIHLREKDRHSASADVTDPTGEPARFVLVAERPLSDPTGAGKLALRLERQGASQSLQPGEAFRFGQGMARVVALSRWGGFTYARAPGIGLVFFGFAITLAGSFLLLFPAGVARIAGNADDQSRAKVYLTRGVNLLLLEWQAHLLTPESKKNSGAS